MSVDVAYLVEPFELPPRPQVELIESDGEPLESDWHVLQINLLRNSVEYLSRGRDDFYAGGNMFVYYDVEQARQRKYRGPDFFYVNGVPHLPLRRYWCVWEESGRYPDFIVELLSPTTAQVDRTTKKEIYECIFKSHEYVCYDPDTQSLEGWRLGSDQRYGAIKLNKRGWLWIEQLGVWLGTWQGTFMGFEKTWLRFFNKEGQLVPTFDQAAEALARAEKARADAAEAEVQRLKQRLAEKESKPTKRRKGRR